MPAFAAIDFGTSNSTVGIRQHGAPRLLQPETGHHAVPTALFFPFAPHNPPPLTGNAAITSYINGEPGRFMRGLKSVLGTSQFAETTMLNGRATSFGAIIGHYIGWLKTHAEQALGQPLTHLMLGRPVHFLTNQPEADAIAEQQLRQVAASLGITNVAFLAEPLAAAYHYEQQLNAEQLAFIIDIGGGTADLSILRLGPTHAEKADRQVDILATHGLRLGGMMIDQAFALAHVMPLLGMGTLLSGPTGPKNLTVPANYYTQLTTWHRIQGMYEKATLQQVREVLQEALEPAKVNRLLNLLENRDGHRLMFGVEAVKIALSNQPETTLNLGWLESGLTHPLTQPNLAQSMENWLELLTESIHHTLQLAQIQVSQLSTVFLTGGPSAMPLVRATIAAALPHANLVYGDQLTSVGSGLILTAHRHFA